MSFTAALFPLLFGLGLGALLTYLALRGRLAAEAQLTNTFKALAADTLHQNSAAFLQLAEGRLSEKEQAANATLDKKSTAIDTLLKPMQETLSKMDEQIRALELKREGAYRELNETVLASRATQQQLRNETGLLLQALRAPTARGRWGELQLQRILEMTGMSEHAKDFKTQVTIAGEDDKIRPDVIVYMPGHHCLIVDSKVPLDAYLDWVQSNDESLRDEALKQHARRLKDHIKTLSAKAYWEKVEGAFDFVVLFLPGENFLSAALDGDPSLMEYCAQNHVVIATPMTLIAILRSGAYGWRQESLQDNVRAVADLGRKLYGSLSSFTGHMETVGRRLGSTVEAYNGAVGSLERNVLSKARKLAECGLGPGPEDGELESPAFIERAPRLPTGASTEDDAKLIALNPKKN